jgi:MFS family permease
MDRQRNAAGFALGILFAINTMNFFDRQLIGVVAEPIRKQWALTDSQIGWLGTAFTLLYAMVGVPLGRLTDTGKRSRLLGWGIAAWSLLTAASGLAWNFVSMFAARLGVGIGEAACAPASSSLIGDLYPAARRSFALGVFMMGLPIGIFLGSSVGGWLASAYGWRQTFFVSCVPGLLLALAAFLMVEPKRGAAEALPGASRVHQGSPYWRVLRIPTMSWIILSGALFNFNSYAINLFLPAFLIRYHGLNLRNANLVAGATLGAVGALGLLLGGLVVDRVTKARANGRLATPAVALLINAPLVYFALGRPPGDLVAFVALIGVAWTLWYVYYSGVYAAIQDVVEPSLRGTAMALYFFAMYLLGGSFGQIATGRLSDYFARRAMLAAHASVMTEPFRAVGLHHAMYIIPLVTLLVVPVLIAAAVTFEKDMLAVQSWMAAPASGSATPAPVVQPGD